MRRKISVTNNIEGVIQLLDLVKDLANQVGMPEINAALIRNQMRRGDVESAFRVFEKSFDVVLDIEGRESKFISLNHISKRVRANRVPENGEKAGDLAVSSSGLAGCLEDCGNAVEC